MNRSLLVEPNELTELRGDPELRVVDTRGPKEFEEGHIPGALNLPSGMLFDPDAVGSGILPPDEINRRLREVGIHASARLVLYDDSGLVPSARVFWVLEHMGRGNMSLLNGGLPGWISCEFPVETGAPQPDTDGGESPVSRSPESETGYGPVTGRAAGVAHREEVRAALNRDDVVIIDARSDEEYRGVTGAHVRNGHIPGAQHVDWQNHIVDLFDPTLRPLEELAELYARVGVTQEKEIITYCRSAARSSHSYFVLRLLGYSRVRNYAGSWMEWCADPSLPIEGPDS